MKQEEFIKQHPSLKGKAHIMTSTEVIPENGSMFILTTIQDIYETQIDKQKVKEIIKLTQELVTSLATIEEIKKNPLTKKVRTKIKELGIE